MTRIFLPHSTLLDTNACVRQNPKRHLSLASSPGCCCCCCGSDSETASLFSSTNDGDDDDDDASALFVEATAPLPLPLFLSLPLREKLPLPLLVLSSLFLTPSSCLPACFGEERVSEPWAGEADEAAARTTAAFVVDAATTAFVRRPGDGIAPARALAVVVPTLLLPSRGPAAENAIAIGDFRSIPSREFFVVSEFFFSFLLSFFVVVGKFKPREGKKKVLAKSSKSHKTKQKKHCKGRASFSFSSLLLLARESSSRRARLSLVPSAASALCFLSASKKQQEEPQRVEGEPIENNRKKREPSSPKEKERKRISRFCLCLSLAFVFVPL